MLDRSDATNDATTDKAAERPSRMKVAHFLTGIKDSGSLAKAISEGARWITVHPSGPGPGTPGSVVLIQSAADGSGAMRAIGGAGGKLNYLKRHGVRSETHYKANATRRQVEMPTAHITLQPSPDGYASAALGTVDQCLKAAIAAGRASAMARILISTASSSAPR